VAVHAYVRVSDLKPGYEPWEVIVRDLLTTELDLTGGQVQTLIAAAARGQFGPHRNLAKALKSYVERHAPDPGLRDIILELRDRVEGDRTDDATERAFQEVIDGFLTPAERAAKCGFPRFSPQPDEWGRTLLQHLWDVPAAERERVDHLLVRAAKGGKHVKAQRSWSKMIAEDLAHDRERLGALLFDMLEACAPISRSIVTYENQHTLRGIVWLVAVAAPEGIAQRLERYAYNCLKSLESYLLLLGNAAIRALTMLPGTTGVASLSRLRRTLKRGGEIKTVDKALAEVAKAQGISAAELEEIGLPDYGFDRSGTLEIAVGCAVAKLSIDEAGALKTEWRSTSGERLKAPPAALKQDGASALKALKAKTREIGQTLRAQRLRFEGLYLSERILSSELWRQRYVDEPLVAGLTRRLIWLFEIGGDWVAAMPQGAGVVDVSERAVELAPSTRVKLWHPMQSEPAEVLAWRQRLQSLTVTQPFKQAHREIYALTDAERETHDYSVRFDGHIVDQHRFRALCQARGWQCPMFGFWEQVGIPSKRLTDRELRVELEVEAAEETMDQKKGVIRHADLFVSVAGIASEPIWGERGVAFDGYWRRVAFGALTESGKVRHAVLRELLPGLTIAPRCRLEEIYLVVEGKLRTYRIHLGFGNILMEPDSQQLSVAESRLNAVETRARIPFEGDHILSIILSKAFMLADDDKIKDPSIREQILDPRSSTP
jgi:hypothetical protein